MPFDFVFSASAPSSGFRPALVDPSGPEVGSFTINTTSPVYAAPGAAFFFDLSGFTGFDVSEVTSPVTADDPSVHELHIYWDFDVTGSFISPIQVPSEWNSKNVLRHKSTAFAWTEPGTYTVTALVIDNSGNWGRVTTTVTVQSTQTLFPGNRTILVDPAGVGDSSTYPGSQVVTTMTAGYTALAALGQSGCVLLKRGETFTNTADIVLSNDYVNEYLGTWGSGARPIIKRQRTNSGSYGVMRFNNGTNIPERTWFDVEFQGPWDATKEIGDPRFNPCNSALHNVGDWSFFLCQVKISGFSALRPWNGGNSVTRRWCVFDCDLQNWQDYGIHCQNASSDYSQNKWGAVIGSAIHQARKSCQWGDTGLGKNAPLGAWHGPLRYVDVMKFIIQCSSVYSANSWFPNSFQPGLRLAQGADPSRSPTVGGYRIYAANIVSLTSGIGIDGQNSSAHSLPGNHIVENFIIANSPGSDQFIGCGFGGTTFRNGLLIRRNHNKTVSTGEIINLIQHESQPGNATARMDIHDISIINVSTDTDYDELVETETGATATFTNKRLERITYHEPNITSPRVPAAPITVSNGFPEITLYYPNYRRGHSKASIAITTTTSGNTLTVPYPSGVSQSDVVTSGLHGFMIGDEDGFYYNDEDNITFTFNAGDIDILNNTGDTWSGSIRLALELNDSFYDVPGFTEQTTFIPAGRQQVGSNLINGGSGGALPPTPRDMLYNLRDGTPDAGPYEGTG